MELFFSKFFIICFFKFSILNSFDFTKSIDLRILSSVSNLIPKGNLLFINIHSKGVNINCLFFKLSFISFFSFIKFYLKIGIKFQFK